MGDFKPGDRVRVSAEATDVYFGGEVDGVVVEADDIDRGYPPEEKRVLVSAPSPFGDDWPELTQWVLPEDLTALDPANN